MRKKIIKPPFSYYGGKQKIVRHIIPHIPQHSVFVEPFCGGATLLFAKPDYTTGNNHDYIEVINDTNEDVHNFFIQLRDNGEELCRMLELSLYSQYEYKLSELYDGDDKLMKAYYFYINIMQSFSNKLNGGWSTALFNNKVYSYKNKCGVLNHYIDRMRSIYISCEDALRCIERWDSPYTFFYCDPPYPEAEQGHYKGYSQDDFENLLDTLSKCEGSFILSCYPNDAVPKEWKKVEFKTIMSASKDKSVDKERTECIWIRQAKGEPRKDILKIYEKQRQLCFNGIYK